MPPITRKKTNTTLPSLPSIVSPPPPKGAKYKDDDPFERTFSPVDDPSDDDSDHSEYGKKKRKRRMNAKGQEPKKRRSTKPKGNPPAVPDLSDDEYALNEDTEEEEDDGLWSIMRRDVVKSAKEKEKELPQTLTIQVNGKSKDKMVININLADLLKNNQGLTSISLPATPLSGGTADLGLDDTTLVEGNDTDTDWKGFLDLPYELRVRIYRKVFRGPAPIDFDKRADFARSSHFLRTCKIVHEEGADILYGENSFHFARNTECRGRYFEETWKEIGYTDIRRFLEAIGPVNISRMKYVSFMLSDAGDKSSASGGHRFVNDPTLQHIFRLFGANATLTKLAYMFAGRAMVSPFDFHFLKAFTEMRCHNLIYFNNFRARVHKCDRTTQNKLSSVMVVPQETDNQGELDTSNEGRAVEMVYHGSIWCRGIHL